MNKLVIGFCLLLQVACTEQSTSSALSGDIRVTDFTGNEIVLSKPAKRIIALAPHAVENIFSAGAGAKLIGVIEYSNFPPAALELPIMGNYQTINFERILQMQPDLIIAWQTGNSSAAIERLSELGLPVYLDEPHSIADIAKSIRDIGKLAATQFTADRIADQFEKDTSALRSKYVNADQVPVFYQVWNTPLQTINGTHIISDVIESCGGTNIYADEFAIAPVINIESVLERNPHAIIAGGTGSVRPAWLDEWLRWPTLTATKNGHLFHVNPDHIQRHSARILLGMQAICQQLDEVRASRKS